MTVCLDRFAKATCVHCGQTDVGGFNAGYGAVAGRPLCHPNVAGRPDCYTLVTLYRHETPCRTCRGMFRAAGPLDASIWSSR